MSKVLQFKMSTTKTLRSIFDTAKDLLPDINIIATPLGLGFVNNTNPDYVLDLQISASDLGDYTYNSPHPRIDIGLQTTTFSKMLKSISIMDPVEFIILESNLHELLINTKPKNNENITRELMVPLLALATTASDLEIPDYTMKVNLATVDLQKSFKCLAAFTDMVNVIVNKSYLSINMNSHDSSQGIKFTLGESFPEILTGSYNVSPILAYLKSGSLSKNISLQMSKSLPLILRLEFFEKSHFSIIVFDKLGDRENATPM